MRCPNCGKSLPDDAARCPACGLDFGAAREDRPGEAGAGRDGETEPPPAVGRSEGQESEAESGSARYGWGSPAEEGPPAQRQESSGGPDHATESDHATGSGHATDPDRATEQRGTGREPAAAATTVEPASSSQEGGSAFSLALQFPFSRGWRTVGAWCLAFWAVFLGLGVVAVAGDGTTGNVRVTVGTLATAVLVLGPLPFLGYLLRLCRAAARGDERAPAFAGLRENTALGVRALAGLFAFQFLVGLPFLPLLVLSGGEPGATLSLALVLLALGGSLLVGYLLPAFLTIIAVTGSLREAFGTRRVADFAFTTEYFVASLIGVVLLIVLRLVAVLSVLTFVGWLVAVPYSFVAVAAYWGAVYRDQAGPANVPRNATDD